MLGLPKNEVYLVDWTEDWCKEFLWEKERIQDKIGNYVVDIHHIGSTAVKGVKAKPIIDIAVEIEEYNNGIYCVNPLRDLGYSYGGVNVLPERHYFYKGEPRTHQIHMYQTGNEYLREQLKFINYLRKNDHARKEYQELKMLLARENKYNKHKYADKKTEFIQSILSRI